MKINERGSSMIEMLGVLAIIGVLSVGGIAGYTNAIHKYKINKTIAQITAISQNVRTVFANQKNYEGLDSPNMNHDNGLELIKAANIVPSEMINEDEEIIDEDLGLSHHIFNHFGGGVVIWSDDYGRDSPYFTITYFRIPKDVCVKLATHAWNASAMGMTSIYASNIESTDTSGYAYCMPDAYFNGGQKYVFGCPNDKNFPIPIPVDIAARVCTCSNNDCTVTFGFK